MTDTRDENPIDDGYRDPEIDGCHHCRDPRTCDECADEKSRDQYAEHLLKMLAQGVLDAQRGVAAATGNLQELRGPAYDIELAEGADGADALDDLVAAGKLLRNVDRVVRARQQLFKEGH